MASPYIFPLGKTQINLVLPSAYAYICELKFIYLRNINFVEMKPSCMCRLSASLLLSVVLVSVCAPTVCAETYTNPVINHNAPDPTVIRAKDGTYWLYSTESIPNLPIYKSDNLVDWDFVGTAFTDETRPQMVPGGKIWAPDILWVGKKYVLYYSKSQWGKEWECGIGVATADAPEGPFTDHGKLFLSNEIGVQNSIDPIYVEAEGKHWLFWCSFRGIYAIELSSDGLSVKSGAEPVMVAGTFTEATNIFRHRGYYYLVGSAGSCCEGEKSTYRVVVARSKKVIGPYVDKNGVPAIENGFSLLLEGDDTVKGPGHNANFVKDDAGQYWMLYHGYDASAPQEGRKVYLDRVEWDADGWPSVGEGKPSKSAEMPIIKGRGK